MIGRFYVLFKKTVDTRAIARATYNFEGTVTQQVLA